MSITRKQRPEAHRKSNDAIARVYGRVLRGYVQDIEKSPNPSAVVHNSIKLMQAVAVSTFTPAYLRGKVQAMGDLATLEPQDVLWIERALHANNHYLSHSLGPDIAAKIERLRLDVPGSRTGALDAAFGSRVENLYGGALWSAHEAGFASGVRDLQLMVRRLGHPSLHQDDTTDPIAGPQEKKKDRWALLALLLGTDEDTLKAEWKTLQVGVSYVCLDDSRSCTSCPEAAGDYFPPDVAPIPGTGDCGFNCRCWTEIITRNVSS